MRSNHLISNTSDLSNGIQSFYRPIQPAFRGKEAEVFYAEYPPDQNLRPFIYCYWHLFTETPLSRSFYYRVVSDGCIDIFLDLNHPQKSFVMGFCKGYTEFRLENEFSYVGIRFLPSAFPKLFGISAQEISDACLELEAVEYPTFEFLRTHCEPDRSVAQIMELLDVFFLKKLSNGLFATDARIQHALYTILANSGNVTIEKHLNVGLSSRQLRRLFQFYIGASARTFCKVVRFQHLLNAAQTQDGGISEEKFYYDLGYYDQSHFIKDFKIFAGLKPGQFFRKH